MEFIGAKPLTLPSGIGCGCRHLQESEDSHKQSFCPHQLKQQDLTLSKWGYFPPADLRHSHCWKRSSRPDFLLKHVTDGNHIFMSQHNSKDYPGFYFSSPVVFSWVCLCCDSVLDLNECLSNSAFLYYSVMHFCYCWMGCEVALQEPESLVVSQGFWLKGIFVPEDKAIQ